MLLHKKAFYNLLRLNQHKIESGMINITDLEPWQVENYRKIPTDELLERLRVLGKPMNSEEFIAQADQYESPEELVEKIAKEKDPFDQDRLFLIFFELWRRLLPEKRVMSIFCDELDFQISYFLEKKDPSYSSLQDALTYLQEIIEDNKDQGVEKKEAFQIIQMFCAHNLETFFYDYILSLILADEKQYAAELLESFKQCFQHTFWFEYLAARLAILEDPEDGYKQLERLINKMKREPHLDLALDILYFLGESGNQSLFHDLAIKTLPLLKIEADFQELMDACFIHYNHLELKQQGDAIAEILNKRQDLPIDMPIQPSDGDVKALRRILDQRLQLASD